MKQTKAGKVNASKKNEKGGKKESIKKVMESELKKPKSGYILYSMAVREQVVKEHGLKGKEVMSVI